ncbi:MAG: response regulator [Syntrophales bacterium]|nr:response regulator [Syntrophales bacterium]
MKVKGKPVNILLVEDNEDHAELTLSALRNNNVINEIHVVRDGEEALDFVYHRGKYTDVEKFPLPGLILLDISLPKLSGLEVLETFKKDPELKVIPVIMLTTSSREEEILRSYANGANSYVTKPVDFDEFVRKIKDIKLYWTLTNSLPL